MPKKKTHEEYVKDLSEKIPTLKLSINILIHLLR